MSNFFFYKIFDFLLLGSSGCHVYDVDVFSMEFYSRLGFVELKNVTHVQDVMYFGRIF
jgi:hypothetical protein